MPVAVPITNAKIKTGAGIVYVAPLGSTPPVMTVTGSVFTDTWPMAWVAIGPTDNGFSESHQRSTDNVDVEESLYPVRYEETGATSSFSFAMAHVFSDNWKLALAGATIVTTGTGATTLKKMTPPLIGASVRVMVGWESTDNTERVIGYQCFQTGQVQPSARKGSNKRLLAVEYRLELPDPAVAAVPFERWFAGAAG